MEEEKNEGHGVSTEINIKTGHGVTGHGEASDTNMVRCKHTPAAFGESRTGNIKTGIESGEHGDKSSSTFSIGKNALQAKELRIGNIVELNGSFSIHKDYFKVDIDNIGWYESFEPIPLTEDILLKCGFEKNNDFECWVIKTKTGEIIISYDGTLMSTDTVTKVEFLHQLQNLYFALTGEELNIEL